MAVERCYNQPAYFSKSAHFQRPSPGFLADPRGKTACEGPVKTRLIRPAAIALLVVAVTLPIGAADSAKSLYNKGKDAEARQNYESAFDFYRQAYEQKTKDLAYRAKFERTRFLAAASH